jgi:hypothetical protein
MVGCESCGVLGKVAELYSRVRCHTAYWRTSRKSNLVSRGSTYIAVSWNVSIDGPARDPDRLSICFKIVCTSTIGRPLSGWMTVLAGLLDLREVLHCHHRSLVTQ